MSKDKISKDKKKTPAAESKKAPSDYQSGKKSSSGDLSISASKKK